VTIVDASAGDATGFWEPGLTLQAGDWGRMVDLYRCLLGEASGVVLSGSVPRATPEDAYAQLITIAHDRGVPVVLDAEGAHVLSALRAEPEIVKANAAELAAATGQAQPSTGAELLRRQGAGSVVVSLGPGGLLAAAAQGPLESPAARLAPGQPHRRRGRLRGRPGPRLPPRQLARPAGRGGGTVRLGCPGPPGG
jgi:tagatose 6-phosphate kinase